MAKGTVFITGGARRVGRALSLVLAREGYNIALHYHHSREEAKSLADEIHNTGKQCNLYQCDLADTPSIKPMIQQVFADFPDCNVLINNASLFKRSPFLETDEAMFDQHFDLNLKAPFFLTQYFADLCKQGQVINMLDSYISKHKTPYFAYLLSKKALYDFTKMAAVTLGPSIQVNGISPGIITELPQDNEPSLLERKRLSLPLQCAPKVEYIISAILQLLNSEYLTGQIINVDGGEYLL